MNQVQTVIVFVDESEPSQEALALLRKAGVQFTTIRAVGTSVPTARLGTTSYVGVRDIALLANSLRPETVPG